MKWIVREEGITSEGKSVPVTGQIFDVYHLEDTIYLWVVEQSGNELVYHLFTDTFYPEIYADGPPGLLNKFAMRLKELGALACPPDFVERRHFYENKPVRVMRLKVTRPSVLNRIRKKLFAFYGKMDIYHSDLEIPVNYMYTRGLYPLAQVRVFTAAYNRIEKIEILDSIRDPEFAFPSFHILYLYTEKSHRLKFNRGNELILRTARRTLKLRLQNEISFLESLNRFVREENPDIVISSYGDQSIFPQLFEMAQRLGVDLELDRDLRTLRKIHMKGSSYVSYGNTIFRAAGYPLFGRWHIDAANSFVMKESRLFGVIELARLTRFPVQRLSRASTGIALTYMETRTAWERNYLVPWQKSRVEESKTAYDLLLNDKGGLIYMPDVREAFAYENVGQIDFSQMYPTIMVKHNISPETVNCLCCNRSEAGEVPEIGYRICKKRQGVVSQTLAHLLERRAYLKARKKEAAAQGQEKQVEIYDSRQSSLKWMLVTSFGYLGYRNAKFGKLESHEAVTAFGRDKILQAKEIIENRGFCLLNAIVDCLFIRRTFPAGELKENDLLPLCEEITGKTGVEMSVDAVFSWVVFFASRADKKISVSNRYMGRYVSGGIKVRGIALRRKDTASFVKEAQRAFLAVMERAKTLAELASFQPLMESVFRDFEFRLQQREVPWRELLIRRTASKERGEYSVSNATVLAMDELQQEYGLSVQAGEKLNFLVMAEGSSRKEARYLSEEKALRVYGGRNPPYDIKYYRKLLFKAYEELWEYFAAPSYFRELVHGQRELFERAF